MATLMESHRLGGSWLRWLALTRSFDHKDEINRRDARPARCLASVVQLSELINIMSPSIHLHDELAQTHDRVVVETRFGTVAGGRSKNGAAVFLGKHMMICCPLVFPFRLTRPEIPYALPPQRFENPVPLPPEFRYQDKDYITESSCQSRWFHPPQSQRFMFGIDLWPDAVQPNNDGQSAGAGTNRYA